MPTVTVTDLVVTTRKVKMPAYCPGCGGRLKENRALHVRGFVDETRTGRLPKSGDDKIDAIAGVVLGDAGYDSGEEFINNVSVTCRRRSRVLASGTYTVTPTSEGRHARQKEQR
jgi:hypothetical protein